MSFWSLTLILMNLARAQRFQKWTTEFMSGCDSDSVLLTKWADIDLGQNI